jgi:hypothetical protein
MAVASEPPRPIQRWAIRISGWRGRAIGPVNQDSQVSGSPKGARVEFLCMAEDEGMRVADVEP